ncbi:MAG: DUF2085 domain-containing protein [Candidatus Nanoarchaeia archaeon]
MRIYITILLLLALLNAWIIFATLDSGLLADSTYVAFSLVCHQKPERSFHLAGSQMPVCQRCFAIYMGAFLGGLFYSFSNKIPLSYLFLALLPMAIDGVGQLFGVWQSNYLSRVFTGALAGGAGMLFIMPALMEIVESLVKFIKRKIQNFLILLLNFKRGKNE